MKNILYILAFILFGITKTNAQSVSMSLACPSTTITAGANFNVNANYSYNSISGDITVTVNYDPTKVVFMGSPGCPSIPVSTSGVLVYTIPTTGGGIQAGSIQMTFQTICPQTCFGPGLTANFTGNISSASPALTSAALPCGTNYSVVNNLGGNLYYQSYDCRTNQVTFRIYIAGASCYKVENPTIKITNSIPGATIISTSSTFGPTTFNASTNIISVPNLNPGGGYNVYYTLQLPCTPLSSTMPPTTIITNAVLGGDNCGAAVSNLFTFAPLTYTSPTTNSSAASSTSVSGTTATVTINNNGSTPINVNMTTLFPNIKITSATLSGGGLSSSKIMNLYDCTPALALSSPYSATGILPISVPSIIPTTSKAQYTVNNLMPGESVNAVFTYDSTAACSGTPLTTGITFTSTGNYTGISESGTSCYKCSPNDGLLPTTNTYYPPTFSPNIGCNGPATQHVDICHRYDEVLPICVRLKNNGTDALLSGIIKIELPNYLDLVSGTVTVNSLSTGFTSSTTLNPGYLTISLSNPVPVNGLIDICFDYKINSLALNGLHNLTYIISGTGYSPTSNYWCKIGIRICQDPKVEILKEVKGSEDSSYSASGNAMAGTTAKYRITISNTGNTPINNMEIVDRYPQNASDVKILNCISRPSDFAMFPNATSPVLTPLIPGMTTSFATSASGINKIPSSWTSTGINPSCDTASAFSAALTPMVDNTMKINVSGTLLPFTSYTIEIEATVPYSAIGGQLACNTAALRCSYLDETAAPHVMEIIESDPACLKIAPPPCDNCKGLLNSSSLILNPGTTSSSALPYVVKTGSVTITIAKPVQEIRLSIADLQYSWDKEGCTNCKSPAIARGCLFPISTTQNIGPGGASGYLVWDNYMGIALPTATAVTDCPEELVWKLGVMLQPGTYTIPIQLTLPKPVIEDCCTLHIDKFNIKVSLKDADCKVCESFVSPKTDDCCTGSKWIRKQMTWSLHPQDLSLAKNERKAEDTKKFEDIIEYNKLINTGVLFANPLPWYGVQNVECGQNNVYRILAGETRTFSGSYSCNPSLKNCTSQVFISIKTINGNYISVVNQPSNVVQTFALAGEYEITYSAFCGTVKCNECKFKVIVEKNCCPAVKKSPSTITTTSIRNHHGLPFTSTLSFLPTTAYSSYSNIIVNLNYNCPQGCSPTYVYTRSRKNAAGVYVLVPNGGGSGASPLSIDLPPTGEDRISISVKCGDQICASAVEVFNITNSLIISTGNPYFPVIKN